MKNQYVGDIGDYGKYGLLRFLAENGIRIGVNWYLTKNDESEDGRFTDYLQDIQNPDRRCDPKVFDTLREIIVKHDRSEKTVDMICKSDLIRNTVYYDEVLQSRGIDPKARETNRRFWFNNSTLILKDAELIFADPDNGLSFTKSPRSIDSEKFVFSGEIAEYYTDGKDVVYYCHKGRRRPEDWEQAKIEIRKTIRDAQILGVTFHRGTQRSYIFVVHPDHYRTYVHLLNRFIKTPWGKMFTREPVQGNVLTTEEEMMWEN